MRRLAPRDLGSRESGRDRPAALVHSLVEGGSYVVMLSSQRDGACGTAHLTLRRPVRAVVTLAADGVLDRTDDAAVLHGRAYASRRAVVEITIVLRQRVGDVVVASDSMRRIAVGRRPTAWRMRFEDGRAHRPGPARVSSLVWVFDDYALAREYELPRTTVRLR